MKPPLKDGTVLLTGASSGIGREMARQLAGTAKTLVLVARRKDRLEELARELAGSEILVRPCDLADPAELDSLLEDLPPVDILINNAGMGDIGLLEFTEWEKIDAMIRVNVTALTRLTRSLVGPMIEKGRGGILNVSSGYGLTFSPVVAAYVGTKHYVSAFTDSLRVELAGTGVVVSQLCPGPVETEFLGVAGKPEGLTALGLVQISAARCARAGLRGFACGRAITVPGFWMWIFINLGRMTPRPVLRLFYSWIGGTLRKKNRA